MEQKKSGNSREMDLSVDDGCLSGDGDKYHYLCLLSPDIGGYWVCGEFSLFHDTGCSVLLCSIENFYGTIGCIVQYLCWRHKSVFVPST